MSKSPTRWLVFDAEGVTGVDASGVEVVEGLVEQLRTDGITLVFTRAKSPLQQLLDTTGLSQRVGPDHFYPNVDHGPRRHRHGHQDPRSIAEA